MLALYTGFLRPVFPNITGHLVSASVMAIPACFVMSKILVPETEEPKTLGRVVEEGSEERKPGSALESGWIKPMESIVAGAMDGVKLAVAIGALLIAVLGFRLPSESVLC